MQAEAAACGSTVPHYEGFEQDADVDVSPGMGSKLSHMYKKKLGRYSEVPKIFSVCYLFITVLFLCQNINMTLQIISLGGKLLNG